MFYRTRWTVLVMALAALGARPAYADIFVPGMPSNPAVHALDVSADGTIAVGFIESAVGDRAFLWQPSFGMVDLAAFLISCGADCSDEWTLLRALDISDGGETVTGVGYDLDGVLAAWTAARPQGDANGDWQVDIFDVNQISANWGTGGPSGDVNGDGLVDIFDVNLVSQNWSQAPLFSSQLLPPPVDQTAEAPEPSTAAIWGLLGCGVAFWRFRARRSRIGS